MILFRAMVSKHFVIIYVLISFMFCFMQSVGVFVEFC